MNTGTLLIALAACGMAAGAQAQTGKEQSSEQKRFHGIYK